MFERKIEDVRDYKLSDSPFSAHRVIIDYAGGNKKVLDLGCGSGYLGAELKKKGCYVAGVEADAGRAGEAKKVLDKIIADDIENLSILPWPEQYFDVIILADLLEHLKRPDIMLIRLKKYLKPGGSIIVSVPNIARMDIRIRLLFGRFDYEDGGILDKTHLRFFTYNSLKKMLQDCGFAVVKTNFGGIFGKLRLFPGLLAFQFILLATRLNDKDEHE